MQHQLGILIKDNRSDPRAIQMVQIPGPGLKVGVKPQGLPGEGRGCSRLGWIDALHMKQTSIICTGLLSVPPPEAVWLDYGWYSCVHAQHL